MQRAVFLPPTLQWRCVLDEAAADAGLEPVWAANAHQAVALASEEPCAVFVCDALEALGEGAVLLEQIHAMDHRPHILLTAGNEIEQAFKPLHDYAISALLPRKLPPGAPELRCILQGLDDPWQCVGLKRYLPGDCRVAAREIRGVEDKTRVVEDVCSAIESLRKAPLQAFDARLVLEELLNNALMHAFRTDSGEAKYHLPDFKHLAADEQVVVEHSVGPHWIGLSVTDNQGNLAGRQVLERLSRQYSLAGLTDENGRGLFLARALATSLILCIVHGEMTQICVLFDLMHPQAEKTLAILEAPAVSAQLGTSILR